VQNRGRNALTSGGGVKDNKYGSRSPPTRLSSALAYGKVGQDGVRGNTRDVSKSHEWAGRTLGEEIITYERCGVRQGCLPSSSLFGTKN
jgi:hypothetical protein